jgi:hypothetical protein
MQVSSPGERDPGTHWIGSRVGPSVGLGAVENRKFSCTCSESKSDSSVVQPITRHCSDWDGCIDTSLKISARAVWIREILRINHSNVIKTDSGVFDKIAILGFAAHLSGHYCFFGARVITFTGHRPITNNTVLNFEYESNRSGRSGASEAYNAQAGRRH